MVTFITIAIYQNWSQFPKLVKILTIDQNFHNYLQLFTIVQSQLLFVTIGNNCHNFLGLPQLVIIFMTCQNCDYWREFSQLITIGQNCHNWSKLSQSSKSQLARLVTIGTIVRNWSQLSHLVTFVKCGHTCHIMSHMSQVVKFFTRNQCFNCWQKSEFVVPWWRDQANI